MAWTKAKTAVAVAVGILLATGTTVSVWQYNYGKDFWQQRFDAAYKLKRGEVVRFIPPPFVSARADFYHTEPVLHVQAQYIPKPPDRFVFKQINQEKPTYAMCVFGGGSANNPLYSALNYMLQIKQYELEGPDDLLKLNVHGDWTIREGASREVVLAALEPVLFKATKRHVHFEKRTVDRDIIVVSGDLKLDTGDAKGVSGGKLVKMYAEHPDVGRGQTGYTLGDLAAALGEHLNTYVVNEAQAQERFDWECYADASSSRMGNRQAELIEKVLKNLSAQTGLFFTHETRPVDIWFITEQK